MSTTGNLSLAGIDGETRSVTVQVSGDTLAEFDDTFLVTLSRLTATGRAVTIANGAGVGTILNDDNGVNLLENGILLVLGTEGKDDVKVKDKDKGDLIEVEADLGASSKVKTTYSAAAVDQIVIYLFGGDDKANIQDKITKKALVFGGSGNDKLKGGGGPTVLVGGDDKDDLDAGDAFSVLIGGLGEDHLTAGKQSALLIGGTTAYDNDRMALQSILAEWSSNHPVSQKIGSLSGTWSGPSYAARYFLVPGQTVWDDGVADKLKLGEAIDWYFARLSSDDDDPHEKDIVDSVDGETRYDVWSKLDPL